MNRKGFLELLQRYADGTCSPEERQMMDYWYELLDQADDDKNNDSGNFPLEEMLWTRIQQRIQPENTPDHHRLKWWPQGG